MAKSKDKKSRRSLEEERSTDAKMVKESETIDVEIKAVGEKPDKKTSPIIGYFPSGYDPLKNSNETEPSSRVKVYKNANSRNPKNPRMQVVVGASGSAVNFVGTNYSGEATTPQLCNYALAVLDKETCTLKMVPIAANRIFRLEPKVGGLDKPENELPDKEDDTAEEKAVTFRNLTLKYSTKKNIRKDKKRESLRETGDPGMQEDMDHKLKAIEVKTEALEAIASTDANARNIPPYDMEATVAENAYPLDRIILKGEWDYLTDIFELAEAGSEVPEAYPSFVRNRFHELQTVKDESKKRRMASILSYISHLIRFKDRHSMDGVSSAKHHKLPSILSQKFSSLFGSTKEKRIPDDKQKLLISYVLVLSLFADDFRSDPSDIAKDLRTNPLTLRTHYEYLGCKFVRDNKVLIATLPVPLEFNTIRRKRKR